MAGAASAFRNRHSPMQTMMRRKMFDLMANIGRSNGFFDTSRYRRQNAIVTPVYMRAA
jgi:hypothetical protein